MNNVDLSRYKRIVQYFWDPEPKNDEASRSPIWCLGVEYPFETTADASIAPSETTSSTSASPSESAGTNPSSTSTPPSSDNGSPLTSNTAKGEGEGDSWPAPFLDDFESKIWLTYRSHFPAIPMSPDPKASSTMSFSTRLRSQFDQGGFTTDTGWGCMIRSGQCLLANALLLLRFGRGELMPENNRIPRSACLSSSLAWRRGDRSEEERKIISYFADDPRAPFSIHKFVEHGALACGKHPGEWFGPSATARCIQYASPQDPSTLQPWRLTVRQSTHNNLRSFRPESLRHKRQLRRIRRQLPPNLV